MTTWLHAIRVWWTKSDGLIDSLIQPPRVVFATPIAEHFRLEKK